MKKIRVLQVVFEPEIEQNQVSAFRGAIIEKTGKDCVLFHNHIDDGFRYNYPLIQYKRIRKNPAIICVEKGVDEIHKFFENKSWMVNMNGKVTNLKIVKLNINQFNLNVWDKFFSYRIFNWLALNKKNADEYKSLEGLAEKIQLLERIMTANILSFAKGIDWYLEADKKIEVKITNIMFEGSTKYKNIHRPVFDVEFKTNVFLPNNISLGKASSSGYGVIYVAGKN